MLNTTKAFIMSLFELFLIYIVFANFVGWSGASLNVTGYNINWDNSYVGFQSFDLLINDFREWIDIVSIQGNSLVSMSAFLGYLTNLLNALTLGIPKWLVAMANNKLNLLNIGEFLFNFFGSPLLVLGWSLVLVAVFLYWIAGFITVFLRLCGGAYNITFHDTDDVWNQWSSVVDEWSWSLIQVPII